MAASGVLRRVLVAGTAAQLAAALAALLVIDPPPALEVRSWDSELVGVVAQVNDVLALDLLFALIGRERSEPAAPGTDRPDPARMEAGCARLGEAAAGYLPLVGTAPPPRADAAQEVKALVEALRGFSTDCIALAKGGDPEAFTNSGLGEKLLAAAAIQERLARKVDVDADCPPRLEETVESCREF